MDNSRFWWQAAADAPGPDPGDPGDSIGESLRFRNPPSSTNSVQVQKYLSRTIAVAGDSSNWTASFWVKKGDTGTGNNAGQPDNHTFLGLGSSTKNYIAIRHGNQTAANQRHCMLRGNVGGAINPNLFGVGKNNEIAAWYHIVVRCENLNYTYWQNGIEVLSGTGGQANALDAGSIQKVGADSFFGFLGYMAAVHFIDGQALDSTTFGRFNANSVWVPVDPKKDGDTAWYGTNGFHLTFADGNNVGKDYSGNGNDFTATGFETTNTSSPNYDLMQDSPTNNFAIINRLYRGASTSNANLTTANATGKPTILGLPGQVHVGGNPQQWDGTEAGWTYTGDVDFGQRLTPGEISTANMPAASLPDTITGTFTGNSNADGPFVYTGCIPARIQYGTIDVKYQDRLGQTNVDFLSNGFKVRSTTSNSGTVNYTVTTTHDGGEYDGFKVPFQSPAPAVFN